MYIDITEFFNNASPMDYSASVLEIGHNAAQDTWCAAIEDAPDYTLLDTEEKRQAFRDHCRGYGAWSEEEIACWSDVELTALLIQFIAADMREFDEMAGGDWREWERLCNDGACSSRLFAVSSLAVDGRIYYYIGE